MDIQLIRLNENLIHHNMYSLKANVGRSDVFSNRVITLIRLGLNKYKKKVYKKTKNLLTGSTEQDEEYQKVFFKTNPHRYNEVCSVFRKQMIKLLNSYLIGIRIWRSIYSMIIRDGSEAVFHHQWINVSRNTDRNQKCRQGDQRNEYKVKKSSRELEKCYD